jgi:hypothetical protein
MRYNCVNISLLTRQKQPAARAHRNRALPLPPYFLFTNALRSNIAIDQLAQSTAAGVIGISHYMHGQVCLVSTEATSFLREPGTVHIRIGTTWEDSASSVPFMRRAETGRHLLRPSSGERERIYSNYQTFEGKRGARAIFGGITRVWLL